MSDNKYIIDKDSLTGIADAIRNKLGNGASIDDPAAGYYPDPTKSTFLAKFTTVGGRHQTGNGRYCHIAIWGISASDMTAVFGDTICGYLRITSLGDPVSAGSDARYVEQREFSIIPHMNDTYGTSKKFTWAKDATILLPIGDYYSSKYGQPSTAIMFTWQDSGGYKYNYDITVPDIRVEFLDQNQNLMTPAIGGFSDSLSGWSSVSESGDLTHTFEGEIGYSPIPFSIDDMQDKITNYLTSNIGGGGTLETWKWSDTDGTPYLTFPSDFSIENLKDLTCVSNGYPRGLYKDSLGKPVSMKDQGISLPSSFSTIGSPLTVAKISTAHNEGRTFCIPWDWTGVKTIPDNTFFVWFVVEPNDSKIYLGAGRYANYVGNGKWTVIYT